MFSGSAGIHRLSSHTAAAVSSAPNSARARSIQVPARTSTHMHSATGTTQPPRPISTLPTGMAGIRPPMKMAAMPASAVLSLMRSLSSTRCPTPKITSSDITSSAIMPKVICTPRFVWSRR